MIRGDAVRRGTDGTGPTGASDSTVPGWQRRLWLGFLVGGGALLGLYYLVPFGIPSAVIYQLLGLATVAALHVGVRLYRPTRPSAWYLMAGGLALWSLADGIGNWLSFVVGLNTFPTLADPTYLLGYVLVAAGMVLLIRGRNAPADDRGGLLDSLILTTSLAMLSWVLLTRPVIDTYADSPLAAVTAAAYPAADIVLAGLVLRLLTTPSGRTRSYRLLVLAIVLLIAADSASTALQLLAFNDTRPIDVLWLASYVVWGAAALEPSMVSLTAARPPAPVTFTRARLAALTLAVLIAPLTMAVEAALGRDPNIWAAVVFSVIAFCLVVGRMNLSIEQIQAANAERAAAQAQLSHQAAHDTLTGLANRPQAMLLIIGALNRAQRGGTMVGLLFIDLDGFKQVNDTLGHQAGDEVLREAAARMLSCVRAGDSVARLGGDEFVVLLEPVDEQASAVMVAERIIASLSEPILLHTGHEARIGGSIGLAISQDAGLDADRLLQEADLAVYRAKAAGKGRVEVFDRSLRERLSRRALIESSIEDALATGSLRLEPRPVVELITGELASLEVRTRCPLGADLVDRADLLADLGRSPAVLELDARVILEAARWVAGLDEGLSSATVAVPVTGQHLVLPRIRDDVAAALSATGAQADRLVLLLPAAEVSDDSRLLANLDVLRGWGVRCCLDGFGVGTAPTNQLLRLPVSSVRLDERLLTGSPASAADPSGEAAGPGRRLPMLRLTVQTARAFGYRVIAPALTDAAALTTATQAGCEFGQGPAAEALLQDELPVSLG